MILGSTDDRKKIRTVMHLDTCAHPKSTMLEMLCKCSTSCIAVNRRMDDWVMLDDLDLSTVELPEIEVDASGK